ncbi:MAG TPA: tyrosine-type recombinase/integrase [Kofleriaceae bacterium]|jgi:integrase|nr:tyrosine-type recombinase/integrase [Kofleriaceae bacterium]
MAAKTRAACKRAGLAPLTFHSLRATYATLTADAGLPIGKLSALLGHADAATTAIYIRPESSRAAADPRAILGGTEPAPPTMNSDWRPN